MSDVTHRKRGLRFEKSQLVEIETWSRPDEFVRYGHRACCGADGNIVIERLCFSLPYVEKPLNSKVIKSFVPELRSRECFSCFGIPMLSLCYIWTFYEHSMYISHIHVWVCYTVTTQGISKSFRQSWFSCYSLYLYIKCYGVCFLNWACQWIWFLTGTSYFWPCGKVRKVNAYTMNDIYWWENWCREK